VTGRRRISGRGALPGAPPRVVPSLGITSDKEQGFIARRAAEHGTAQRKSRDARFFVAWILAHPAVTCIIPATRNPEHAAANLAAASAPLPDETVRRRMAAHFGSQ
jgi:aryl-alcohol dehydrogenase-like predicted oxidoreductase